MAPQSHLMGALAAEAYAMSTPGPIRDTHAVETRWSRNAPARGYPAGVVAVPKPIPDIAFFLGGCGLWRPDPLQPLPQLPVGGVMVLGHNVHSAAGYRASLKRGREAETQPTWRNMLSLFEQVSIDQAQCFFTNVYMGFGKRKGTAGPFPGATDVAFVTNCVEFLRAELSAQRPRLIVRLGMNVPPPVARLSSDLSNWGEGGGIKHLDASGPVRTSVTFSRISLFATTVVALIHPSLRHASIRFRSYRGSVGHEADMAILRDALASHARAM